MRKAVYAGSFDPITNGHMWIIKEASLLFDSLVVAIGENFEKSYSFSVEERIEFLKHATKGIKNIEVAYFSNEFLVNYASSLGANYIIRGIRNAGDYEYEKNMRYINSDLNHHVSTVFFMPPRNYAEVSSSMVKSLVGSKGWDEVVKKYVPTIVYEKLKERLVANQRTKGLIC